MLYYEEFYQYSDAMYQKFEGVTDENNCFCNDYAFLLGIVLLF